MRYGVVLQRDFIAYCNMRARLSVEFNRNRPRKNDIIGFILLLYYRDRVN